MEKYLLKLCSQHAEKDVNVLKRCKARKAIVFWLSIMKVAMYASELKKSYSHNYNFSLTRHAMTNPFTGKTKKEQKLLLSLGKLFLFTQEMSQIGPATGTKMPNMYPLTLRT
jgi:hypothetical protein